MGGSRESPYIFAANNFWKLYLLEKGKLIHFVYAGVCTWLMLTLSILLTSSSCILFKKHKWNVWWFVTRTAEWGLTLSFTWLCWCWQYYAERGEWWIGQTVLLTSDYEENLKILENIFFKFLIISNIILYCSNSSFFGRYFE